MEQVQKVILYAALVMVCLMLWSAWKKDNPVVPFHPVTQAQEALPGAVVAPIGPAATPIGPAVASQAIQPTQTTSPVAVATSQTKTTKTPKERVIDVQTDVLNIEIDKLGGNIIAASLPKYPETLKTPDKPYQLMTDSTSNFYVTQSALMGKLGPDTTQAQASYQSEKKRYTLEEGKKDLVVALHWKNNKGLEVIKKYSFKRGSYLINVSYEITNRGKQRWSGKFYAQLTRKKVKAKGNHLFQIHPFTGAAVSSPEKRYQQLSFKDLAKEPLQQSNKEGWIGMIQHYFLGAWIPNAQEIFSFYSKSEPGDIYTIGMASPTLSVAPGGQETVKAKLYIGPEIGSTLKKIAPGLNLTVSYGWLWFIAIVVFWVMEKIHSVVGNWGWSIIFVTILIKLMFYHLSAKSYASMAKMRGLQPKIQALRERVTDKQQQSKAMMELYKKEKVNPLGGCLPIVVQIPVFFALYMVLIESVQLRQAPWILWIKDLAVPDPLFILPVIMGITMFIQQKLNPAPPDPTQAKVMMFLPVVFTILFAWFPAGLVLYWVVNNMLSVLQQWYITRKYEMGRLKGKTTTKTKTKILGNVIAKIKSKR